MDDIWLPRKWTLRAEFEQQVFINHPGDAPERCVMRALLWALFVPLYPGLLVERLVDDRYRPALVALDAYDVPCFWAEVAPVSGDRVREIANRYRTAPLVIAHWETFPAPLNERACKALRKLRRSAPIEMVTFPDNSYARFISEDGLINITRDLLDWESVLAAT